MFKEINSQSNFGPADICVNCDYPDDLCYTCDGFLDSCTFTDD